MTCCKRIFYAIRPKLRINLIIYNSLNTQLEVIQEADDRDKDNYINEAEKDDIGDMNENDRICPMSSNWLKMSWVRNSHFLKMFVLKMEICG